MSVELVEARKYIESLEKVKTAAIKFLEFGQVCDCDVDDEDQSCSWCRLALKLELTIWEAGEVGQKSKLGGNVEEYPKVKAEDFQKDPKATFELAATHGTVAVVNEQNETECYISTPVYELDEDPEDGPKIEKAMARHVSKLEVYEDALRRIDKFCQQCYQGCDSYSGNPCNCPHGIATTALENTHD